MYVALAERHGWTPEQINRMDPDYIDELLVRLKALGDVQEAEAEERRRKEKKARVDAKRAAGRGGRVGDDVDISEIK